MTSLYIARMKPLSAFLLLAACFAISLDGAQSKEQYSKQEIKDLLSRMWQSSELDLDNFRDYVFCEREVREYTLLYGSWEGSRSPHENYRREYVWIIRDGHFVRSLTRLNGVEVSAQQQKDSEEQWIKEEQKRAKAKSALEYFFLSDRTIGSPFALKQMKEGNYKYKAEATLKERKVIMLRADYSRPLAVGYTLFIAPDENRLVQFDVNLGSNGKYSMVMGQPVEKTWLPVTCAGSFEWNYPALSTPDGFKPACHFISRETRVFYSFKKSDVKAKFWFEGVDAEIGHDTDKPQSKH
jgi:hypothetical protein